MLCQLPPQLLQQLTFQFITGVLVQYSRSHHHHNYHHLQRYTKQLLHRTSTRSWMFWEHIHGQSIFNVHIWCLDRCVNSARNNSVLSCKQLRFLNSQNSLLNCLNEYKNRPKQGFTVNMQICLTALFI